MRRCRRRVDHDVGARGPLSAQGASELTYPEILTHYRWNGGQSQGGIMGRGLHGSPPPPRGSGPDTARLNAEQSAVWWPVN